MSPFLRVLENEVQLVCLAFLTVVYAVRLAWILRFRPTRERGLAEGDARGGALYSLSSVAMPWAMESIRRKPFFYAQFVVFHLGVVAAIAATFIIPYAPAWFRVPLVRFAFQAVIGAAFLAGILRLVRRLSDRRLRAVSLPDDYASLTLMIAFFGAGVLAVPNSPEKGEAALIAFFGLTAFFLVYVPFSKICHYLYYPFTRVMLGRSMGHRGVWPPVRTRRGGPAAAAAGRKP